MLSTMPMSPNDTHRFQWQRLPNPEGCQCMWTNIEGANSYFYVVGPDDIGAGLRVITTPEGYYLDAESVTGRHLPAD